METDSQKFPMLSPALFSNGEKQNASQMQQAPPVLPGVPRVDIVDPLLNKLKENLLFKRQLDLENGSIIYMLVNSKKYSRKEIAEKINKSIHWVCRRQKFFVVVLQLRHLTKLGDLLPPCSIARVVEIETLITLVEVGSLTHFNFLKATISVCNIVYNN